MMLKHSAIAAALAVACMGAHAAGTDLGVEVTVTPEACNLSLGGGGKVDYGDLGAAAVKGYPIWKGTHYALTAKSLPIAIDCGTETRVVVSAVDNRAASKSPGLDAPDIAYGLGMAGSKPIGFFELKVPSMAMVLDGGNFLSLRDAVMYKDSDIQAIPLAANMYLSQAYATGFAYSPGDLPAAKRLSGMLEVNPRIATEVIDGATSVVRLDASVTLGLLYP